MCVCVCVSVSVCLSWDREYYGIFDEWDETEKAEAFKTYWVVKAEEEDLSIKNLGTLQTHFN